MQRDWTLPISSDPSHDPVPSMAIHFCFICDKPFTNEASRDRHSQYCRRHTRNRPRSCWACNAAKTKCSFDVPCLRCTRRGIECLYEHEAAARRTSPRPAAVGTRTRGEPCRQRRTSPAPAFGTSHADDGFLPVGDFASADSLAVDDPQSRAHGGDLPPFSDLITQRFSPLTFDELFAFEDDTSPQHRCWADLSLAPQVNTDVKSPHWCAWMRGNVSLAVVTESSLVLPNSNVLSVPYSSRPRPQHTADLIIQSLRSFPTMMIRKETFPWFIHPHLSDSRGALLPEALSSCMSIAQLFASRTSETKAFLRRTMGAEHRRIKSEMYHMSKFELLAAMQACMNYLIIYIIEYSPEDEGDARELLLALHDLYLLFKGVGGRASDQTEVLRASTMWEDWIFAESQIRFANLWLLVGFVVCTKNGNVWDASQSYRCLPLPSSKSLWEARTQSTWEAEYEACRCAQTSGLVTLGDLIDAQQSENTPSNARKLDIWNAGVDNLGCLLNLVGIMQ